MAHQFCEHLDEYGVLFGRAQASYDSCLHIMDKIIEDLNKPPLRRTMEKSLDEWVLETRKMRSYFEDLVNNGSIDFEKKTQLNEGEVSGVEAPLCAQCQMVVPRLVFKEFDLSDESNPTYKGAKLPTPAGVKA